MPGMDGLTLLKRTRELRPDAQIVIMTAHGTMETAIQAMQQGAYDYLAKPFDLDEALLLAERAMTAQRLTQEVSSLRPGSRRGEFGGMRAPSHAAGVYRRSGASRQRRGVMLRVIRGGKGSLARESQLQPARWPALRGNLRSSIPVTDARVASCRPREGWLHRRKGPAAGKPSSPTGGKSVDEIGDSRERGQVCARAGRPSSVVGGTSVRMDVACSPPRIASSRG